MDCPGPKGVLSEAVRSLTKVKPFVHGVGVGMTVGMGTVVEGGTRITIRVGIISLTCVGGRKNAGADWGAQAVRAKKNRTVTRLGSKRGCMTCVKLNV